MIEIIAFAAGFLLDFLWVGCVHSVSRHQPIRAANMAVLFCLCTLVSTILIVNREVASIVAYCAGNWIGTYIAVSIERKKHHD